MYIKLDASSDCRLHAASNLQPTPHQQESTQPAVTGTQPHDTPWTQLCTKHMSQQNITSPYNALSTLAEPSRSTQVCKSQPTHWRAPHVHTVARKLLSCHCAERHNQLSKCEHIECHTAAATNDCCSTIV
jgi:hypothetical protein